MRMRIFLYSISIADTGKHFDFTTTVLLYMTTEDKDVFIFSVIDSLYLIEK